MLRVANNKELRAQIREWKSRGLRIAFVPTMGNLHQGHLSLLDIAREQCDKLISSIFVNPMQFGPNEDLAKYPRTLEDDCKALMEHACDLVYLPSDQDLYPQGLDAITQIQVSGINDVLEGEHRPGHLTGVATIVLKLFNLVQPDIAVFGKKDYQQWRMIEKMVKDLNLNIEVIGGNTVREDNGLALSSRNQYLSAQERESAPLLNQQLSLGVQQLREGRLDFDAICQEIQQQLSSHGFDVDYISIRHSETLQAPRAQDPLVILAAARLGQTRLIDNLEI